MHTHITHPRTIASILAVLLVILFSFTIAHAGGSGSSSSGSSDSGSSSGSSGSSSGSSGSSYSGPEAAPGGLAGNNSQVPAAGNTNAGPVGNSYSYGTDADGYTLYTTNFASGNVGSTLYYSGCNTGNCTSNTTFYSNGNGTYNSATVYTPDTGAGSYSSNGSSGNSGSASAPTASASGPANWCSGENGYCSFSGTQQVFYGANNSYTSQIRTGGVLCSNSVFGDPLFGTVKACYIRPLAPVSAAPASQQAAPAVAPSVTISAIPSIVRSGGATTLSWNGGAADACTISGTDGFTSHAITGSSVISNVTEERTYTITCSSGSASATAKTTVRIVPVWNEF